MKIARSMNNKKFFLLQHENTTLTEKNQPNFKLHAVKFLKLFKH